eukprot:m.239795 g.239795  ORF g.239795 m.239795 type:complete len:883 (+) comp16073_c0_seq1:397-3045(+)
MSESSRLLSTALIPDNAARNTSVSQGSPPPPSEYEHTGKLTTFFGVFVPCVLSIFSVILFLRIGYVLGQAGLILTLSMLVISYLVVTLTAMSVSAISTNGRVGGGGAYYLISRSLGPEFGGSIGLIFFFANIFASGLYVAGFVEALAQNIPGFPTDYWTTFGSGSAVLFVCLCVCLVGAGAFAKAAFVIFLIVMLSTFVVLANFFYAPAKSVEIPPNNHFNKTLAYTGFSKTTFNNNLDVDFTKDYTTGIQQNVNIVFGVLFNGCTGVMAGANMSGDLKDASKSIPVGTIQALAVTFVIYTFLFCITAATTSREVLVNNYGFLQDINMVPPLIVVGIFAATLSAALSCFIGASRILQAISRDKLIGEWFEFFSREQREPIRAVFLCWFLIQCVLLIGSLNIIAPIVSMLFLLSYAITNFACFVLRVTGAPNFRPRFRYFSWHTAGAGFVSCVAVMFFISPLYAVGSFLLMLVLFAFIHFRHVPVTWGDVSQALIYHQVRKYLLRLEAQSIKYWRPQVLMLVVNPRSSFSAVQFTNWMKKGGLFVLGHVVVGDLNQKTKDELNRKSKAWFSLDKAAKVKAFVNVVISDTVRSGALSLIMTSGLGGMRPNIVILGSFQEKANHDQLIEYRNELLRRKQKKVFVNLKRVNAVDSLMEEFLPLEESRKLPQISANDYLGIIQDSLLLEKNVGVLANFSRMIARFHYAEAASNTGDLPWSLDIWPIIPYSGKNSYTYELLLQMGNIVHMSFKSKNILLRVITVVASEKEHDEELKRVNQICEDCRIEADVVVIVLEQQPPHIAEPLLRGVTKDSLQSLHTSFNALMKLHMERTCVLFTYLPEPPTLHVDDHEATRYVDSIQALTDSLPPTVLLRGVHEVVTKTNEAV